MCMQATYQVLQGAGDQEPASAEAAHGVLPGHVENTYDHSHGRYLADLQWHAPPAPHDPNSQRNHHPGYFHALTSTNKRRFFAVGSSRLSWRVPRVAVSSRLRPSVRTSVAVRVRAAVSVANEGDTFDGFGEDGGLAVEI